MKENQISAVDDYPAAYKFMAVHFELNLDVYHVDRTSYDLLNMMGDVGGLIEILKVTFQMIAAPFAIIRLQAMVTNRLFHLPL
jgi:hypothetical protein